MKEEIIIDAISYLDSDLIDNHVRQMRNNQIKKRFDFKNNITKFSTVAAACVIITLCLLPLISSSTKDEKPDYETLTYGGRPMQSMTIEELKKSDTLYSKLDFDESRETKISVSHDEPVYDKYPGHNGEVQKQATIKIVQKYSPEEEHFEGRPEENPKGLTDKVSFTVDLGINKITINPINQGYIVKQINGTEIYCLSDNSGYGIAMFIYEGNRYIIEIESENSIINFDFYLKMLLE